MSLQNIHKFGFCILTCNTLFSYNSTAFSQLFHIVVFAVVFILSWDMFFYFMLIEVMSCVISHRIITVPTSSLTSGCQDLASLLEMDYNGLVLDLACMQDVPYLCSYEILHHFN